MTLRRFYSTLKPDIRNVLQIRVKDAMRAKNTFAATTLRSILAEINAADKTTSSTVSSSAIVNIIRKASARRHDAAEQYIRANRSDLADKELQEASLLEEFLPPTLTTSEIDATIKDILSSPDLSLDENPRKATGKIFQVFYTKVDRSLVDTNLVKSRVDLALKSK
ncbi:hypothetical protein GYMLUDRAFT_34816 [Collybiopsis luxurians FD-317 M1]|nr:hypothetical protein GYMLUDRAFT_34816 [Collybiopsis luxurians FD-317 M1]